MDSNIDPAVDTGDAVIKLRTESNSLQGAMGFKLLKAKERAMKDYSKLLTAATVLFYTACYYPYYYGYYGYPGYWGWGYW
jgi:hypothetical protein